MPGSISRSSPSGLVTSRWKLRRSTFMPTSLSKKKHSLGLRPQIPVPAVTGHPIRSLRFLRRSEYADIVLSRTTCLGHVCLPDRHILKVGIPFLTTGSRKEWVEPGEMIIQITFKQRIGGATPRRDRADSATDEGSMLCPTPCQIQHIV